MGMWKQSATVGELNAMQQNSIASFLGIEFQDIGTDFIVATMPVNERTKQPFGILHGGASVVLSETLGSVAGVLCAEPGSVVVGLEVNANHLRSATDGEVTGVVRPLHIGRSTQVWETHISDQQGRKLCVSRLTVMVKAPSE
ncbi:MAG TPA: esterase [Spongiibacteraceae bacterium]|nr:esterase [Spongiibacteraceae bacterium]HCS27903.1 esterase [Spongiibacteraceae bacterium]|tara:strand:- start:138 stop:563 length:426 start_codon:yes stop_codon:yes gene_type:complete